MKTPVFLTYKILFIKSIDDLIDKDFVVWATQMIQEGYESLNLYELANENEPFNQFELKILTDKILYELELDYSDKNKCIENYIYFLIKSNIENPENYLITLRKLKDFICFDEFSDEMLDFWSLYYAKDELKYSEIQNYWYGVTRENIDSIIKDTFQIWLDNYMGKESQIEID